MSTATPTMEQVVRKYIALRDAKDQAKFEYEEKINAFQADMDKIESWMLGTMQSMQVTSLKTPAGTPYIAPQLSVKCEDPEAIRNFIIDPIAALLQYPTAEQSPSLHEVRSRLMLFENRASKDFVKQYLEDHQAAPPGVIVTTFNKVNFRRS